MVVVDNPHLSTCMWMEGRGVQGMWHICQLVIWAGGRME